MKMPSEKKNKKHKSENKASTSTEPLKPLEHYVDDRLELTKQLFSCLKNKQIKQRLPPNLQNKSIEKIQQICLDEILGISTKRLVSIINNTRCPENTDSDDSEIAEVDEHISLEEISSDSEAEAVQQKVKVAQKKEKNETKKSKNPKEMTMLELLELQARARAIRSQLALEPVTKIELGSDDDEEAANGVASTSKETETKKENDVTKKVKEAKKAETVAPPVKRVAIPPPPPKQTPAPSAKPVKLKRNYKSQSSVTSTTIEPPKKEPTPPKPTEPENDDNDSRSSSPDVVNMDPSPETFFISDSEEELPHKSPKKTPIKEASPEKESVKSPEKVEEDPQPPEDGEIAESSRENSPQPEIKETLHESSPLKEQANDDDVIQLFMSDKEDDEAEPETKSHEKSPEKKEEKLTQPPVESSSESPKKSPDPPADHFDDDVVEIHNSSDDELMNECDKSAGETSKPLQTWEERWLTSSKTQNILKTTQLASKVRGNILKTKKSQKATAKKKEENEKAMKEKVSHLEDGSLEQFNVIKDNSH